MAIFAYSLTRGGSGGAGCRYRNQGPDARSSTYVFLWWSDARRTGITRIPVTPPLVSRRNRLAVAVDFIGPDRRIVCVNGPDRRRWQIRRKTPRRQSVSVALRRNLLPVVLICPSFRCGKTQTVVTRFVIPALVRPVPGPAGIILLIAVVTLQGRSWWFSAPQVIIQKWQAKGCL